MQQKNDKTILLAQVIGQTIKELRLKNQKGSINKFAHEYDLDVGNTSRVEKGSIDVKTVTLWKISESLGVSLSDFIKIIETKIGKDFNFTEE
jgi:transcriptional regulator with XRE-family HTH domain